VGCMREAISLRKECASGGHGMLWNAAYDAVASASSAFSMARSASTSASDARRARARLTDKLDSIHRAIAIAGSGSNWRGGAPFGVGNPENWLGLVKPDGRDGLVRVPGGKAANWSCGGMMWTDECRRHVDRVSPVIDTPSTHRGLHRGDAGTRFKDTSGSRDTPGHTYHVPEQYFEQGL
jgi:hypothetical protein